MVRVVSKTSQKLIVQRQSGGFDNMALVISTACSGQQLILASPIKSSIPLLVMIANMLFFN